MINLKVFFKISLVQVLAAIFIACTIMPGCLKPLVDPVEIYPGSQAKLVKFLDGTPQPAIGAEGTVVTIKVNGLLGKDGKFEFFFNQTVAEVVSIEENLITAKVPVNASSGVVSVLIDGQYYFGPSFTVKGKTSKDDIFNTDLNRANAAINGIMTLQANKFLIYGAFTDYASQASPVQAVTSLAVINGIGTYAADINLGAKGINGPINTVLDFYGNGYLIGGSFSSIDTVSKFKNIAYINYDGTVKTQEVSVINPDPGNHPENNTAIVPLFNGGLEGGEVTNIVFNYASAGDINVFGNFNTYVSTFYERSTKDLPYYDRLQMNQAISMFSTGMVDSTFNLDMSVNKGYPASNGHIFSADRLESNANHLLIGFFTSFNGTSANYIASIRGDNGTLDDNFNPGGTGADGAILKMNYNRSAGTILLTGSFKHYNGVEAGGVVMINEDGSINNSFNLKKLEGGSVNFAGQLSNGKIIVSGTFNKYDDVVRPGFMILNADGTLAKNYNNTGYFRGEIKSFAELPPKSGKTPVIIVGSFDRFDNAEVGNIVKFNLEN